jgi:hypothetical protein
VKIQPSYFDGYQLQEPPTNDDGSNRRLFEEGLVDLMLVRACWVAVCGVNSTVAVSSSCQHESS